LSTEKQITGLKKADPEFLKKMSLILESTEKHATIVLHENPDGDAIGSAVGLGNTLSNRGNKVTIISPNDYPSYYFWIKSNPNILVFNKQKSEAEKQISGSDYIICVDFNDKRRLGKLAEPVAGSPKTKIMIDHHPNPQDFCDLVLSDTTYSSTSELIFDFIKELRWEKYVDKAAAESLFTGIMTDTGSFSHNISDPNTFKVVSELLKYGINAEAIHDKVYNNFSAGRMSLLGYSLNQKMEILPEFKTAVISLTKEELKKFNFVPGDSEGFVNYPLSIAGIVFSALFIEKEDHIKISFRSKGTFPANRFSENHFSGGGHLNAAGGESKLSLGETLETFKQLLPGYKHQLESA
jgi:bifunctional oligoribonuclease and PAP phosphatase NrnA